MHASRLNPRRTGPMSNPFPPIQRCIFAVAAAFWFSGIATAVPMEQHHTAIWFNPERSGEGWVIEVLDPTRAVLTWYTYDDNGRPRWMYGVGEKAQDSDEIVFDELFAPFGPRFDDYDANQLKQPVVGSARLRFEDCFNAALQVDAFGYRAQIPIQKLAVTMGADCGPIHGVPGDAFDHRVTQSGSWYQTSRNGEGFQVQWTVRNEALLTWYTYDRSGQPYWVVGVGRLDGTTIVFPELHSAHGARFGEAFDPDDVQLVPWGELRMSLECNQGNAEFTSLLPEFDGGQRALVTLTRAVASTCPWTRPTLTDLYSISVIELPATVDFTSAGVHLDAFSVSDTGTVAGSARPVDRNEVDAIVWRPGQARWTGVPGRLLTIGPVFITSDGSHLHATDSRGPAPELQQPIVTWNEGVGWAELGSTIYNSSLLLAASHDGRALAGVGRNPPENGSHPWRWTASAGQRRLATPLGFGASQPSAISADGVVVVGVALRFPGQFLQAIRWVAERDPEVLTDASGAALASARACSRGCETIFGAGSVGSETHPGTSLAWYWRRAGDNGYLGQVPDPRRLDSYGVGGVSADGTLVGGTYLINAFGSARLRGFLWTQNTGMQSVETLLLASGATLDWTDTLVQAVSSNGRYVLLRGLRSDQVFPARVALLDLGDPRRN
jgi:hypothetical protein